MPPFNGRLVTTPPLQAEKARPGENPHGVLAVVHDTCGPDLEQSAGPGGAAGPVVGVCEGVTVGVADGRLNGVAEGFGVGFFRGMGVLLG